MVNRSRLERATTTAAFAAKNAATEEKRDAESEVLRLRADREALYRELRRRAPRIEELTRQQPPIEIDDLVARLPPGSLLVWYLVEDESSWLLTLGPRGDVASFAIDAGRERIAELSESLLEAVLSPSPADAYLASARALGELVLGPLARQLTGREQVTQLTIVPDGPLHRTPFGALVLQDTDGRDRHLIELTVPIVSILELGPDESWSASTIDQSKLVALADPTASGSVTGPRATALPGARREAETIASFFEAPRLALGERASTMTLLELGSQADLLHLGIHAESSSRDPLSSALMLWGEREGAIERVEAWRIVEDLELDAKLVTLAACSTATGPDLEGEGPQGLMRTFRLIGAENVVASLWPVEDRATGELMIAFYRHLRDGSRPSVALAQAQRALIEGTAGKADPTRAQVSGVETRVVGGLSALPTKPLSHPYHWAGFQLYR